MYVVIEVTQEEDHLMVQHLPLRGRLRCSISYSNSNDDKNNDDKNNDDKNTVIYDNDDDNKYNDDDDDYKYEVMMIMMISMK